MKCKAQMQLKWHYRHFYSIKEKIPGSRKKQHDFILEDFLSSFSLLTPLFWYQTTLNYHFPPFFSGPGSLHWNIPTHSTSIPKCHLPDNFCRFLSLSAPNLIKKFEKGRNHLTLRELTAAHPALNVFLRVFKAKNSVLRWWLFPPAQNKTSE